MLAVKTMTSCLGVNFRFSVSEKQRACVFRPFHQVAPLYDVGKDGGMRDRMHHLEIAELKTSFRSAAHS